MTLYDPASPADTLAPRCSAAQAPEAEVGLVGSLLLDPAAWNALRDVVRVDDVADPRLRDVLRVVVGRAERGEAVDLALLAPELRTAAGGSDDLVLAAFDAIRDVPTALHVVEYAYVVAAAARERRVDAAARRWLAGDPRPRRDGLAAELRAAVDELRHVQSEGAAWPEPVGPERLLAAGATGVEWAIEPLVARGTLAQFHGAPKAGKSELCLAVAVAMSRGAWRWGEWRIPRAHQVGYLAYEDGEARIGRRLRRYGDGAWPLIWPRGTAPRIEMPRDAHRVEELVGRHALEVLISDTRIHTLAAGADENDAAAMAEWSSGWARVVERTGVAVLFVHHSRKRSQSAGARDDTREAGRGSSAALGAMDSLVAVERDGDGLVVDATGKDGGGRWHLEFAPTAPPEVVWRVALHRTDEALTREGQIVAALQGHGESSVRDVAARASMSRTSAHRTLTDLIHAGRVRQTGRGFSLA